MVTRFITHQQPQATGSSSIQRHSTQHSTQQFNTNMTTTLHNTPYSYSPKKLVESFNELLRSLQQQQEDEQTDSNKATTETITTTKEHDDNNSSGSLSRIARNNISTNSNNNNNNNNKSSRIFKVSAVQLTGSNLPDSNVEGFLQRATAAVRRACATQQSTSATTTTTTTSTSTNSPQPPLRAPQLVLLPELLLGPYFCQSQETCLLQNLAIEIDIDIDHNDGEPQQQQQQQKKKNVIIQHFQNLAKDCNVVLPISLYELSGQVLYNTIIVIDSDGSIKGKYRKSHIPDGTGYQEKFYFSPGDTGFQVFTTQVGKIGVGICWDQWFPECARIMTLKGADILLYPTAIGSEPQDPTINSSNHWQRVMQGHAAANMIPVVASNRYGTEILLHDDDDDDNDDQNDDAVVAGGGERQPPRKKKRERQRITFYGKTFITDNTGEKVAEVSSDDMEKNNNDGFAIVSSTIDPEKNRKERLAWGLFRDRRPELYGVLLTKDGTTKSSSP